MEEDWVFRPPESVFGFEVVSKTLDFVKQLKASTVLLITDQGVKKAGVFGKVVDTLRGAVRFDVFDKVVMEPSAQNLEKVKDFSHKGYDTIVAVGGGSCIDFGKTAALLLTYGGTLANYLGEGKVPGPVLPLIAVPTTSGTGSHVSQSIVLEHEGVKRGISDEQLRPRFAVVDPGLTMTLPPEETRNSGFDALIHAIESYTALGCRYVPKRRILYQGCNPVSEIFATRATRLIANSFRDAVSQGDDCRARRDMSLASHFAGIAFSHTGLGVIHALASTVGGMTGEPHGKCLGIIAPYGMKYNLPIRMEKYARIAKMLGENVSGLSKREAAIKAVEAVDALREETGIPASLGDIGLIEDDVEEIVEKTLIQKRRLVTNPRRVADDIAKVVREAI